MSDPIFVLIAINTAVSVLMCGVAMICRWARVRPAIVAFWWLAALVKLVVPSVVPLPVLDAKELALPSTPIVAVPSEAIMELQLEPSVVDTSWTEPVIGSPASAVSWKSVPWRTWLLSLWIAGSIAWCALALRRLARFDRMVRRGQMVTASPLAVVAVEASISPLLWAFFGRARIVVPKSLFATLSEGERAAVIAHEHCHYRRRDHWVRWIEFGVLAICWWHPLAWWICRRLREAEEMACDAEVVATGAEPHVYATVLLRTALFLADSTPIPQTATTIGSAKSMKARVHSIMNLPTHRPLSIAGWTSLVLLGAFSVLGRPANTQSEPASSPADLASPIPATTSAEVDPSAELKNDPVPEPPNPQHQEVEKAGGGNAPNGAAAEPPSAKPSPIEASNDITVSSHSFEDPNGGIRASITTRFSERAFALLADEVEIRYPGSDEGNGDVVTVRRGSTRVHKGDRSVPGAENQPVFRATGSVCAGWGDWRLIAEAIELTTTTVTATGEPVLLVDASQDPPRTVVTARRMTYDIKPGTVTMTDSVEVLSGQLHLSGGGEKSYFSLDTTRGALRLDGGFRSTSWNGPNRQLDELRSRLLKTWPGQKVVDGQLAPLLTGSKRPPR